MNNTIKFAHYWGFLIMLPLIWLCFYAHPAADDFPISDSARQWGSLATVHGYYNGWTARYTSIFLMTVNPLVFGWVTGYKLVPLLLIAGLYLGVKKFSIGLWGNFPASSLFSLFFVMVFLYNMPDMPGGLYYLGGSLFYQPCNILLAFLIGSLLINPPPLSIRAWQMAASFQLFFQAILIFIIAGTNEIGMFLGLVIAFSGLVLVLWKEKKVSHGWSFLILTASISAILIICAPATFHRMNSAGGFERSLPDVAVLALQGMIQSIIRWFSSPALFIFPVLSFLLFGREKLSVLGLSQFQKLLISISSGLLFYTCFVPSFLGEGLLQGHTENMLLFICLILLTINLRIWISSSQFLQQSKGNALIYLFLSLNLFSPGFRLAVSDLWSGGAAAYSAERDHRDSLMRNTPGDTVWVEAVKHKPKSLFAGDIGDYPDPWYDNHFAAMYRKKWVGLKKK